MNKYMKGSLLLLVVVIIGSIIILAGVEKTTPQETATTPTATPIQKATPVPTVTPTAIASSTATPTATPQITLSVNKQGTSMGTVCNIDVTTENKGTVKSTARLTFNRVPLNISLDAQHKYSANIGVPFYSSSGWLNVTINGDIDGIPINEKEQIYCSSSSGGGSASAASTAPSVLTSIVVTPANQIMQVGNSTNYTATARDQYGNLMNVAITWSGSNATVGSISVTGEFTAQAIGTAKITATNGSISGNSSVTVIAAPTAPKCILNISKELNRTTAKQWDFVKNTLHFGNSGTANCTSSGVFIEDGVNGDLEYVVGSEEHSNNVDGGYNGGPLYNTTSRTLSWNVPNTFTPGETGWVSWVGQVKYAGTYVIRDTAEITCKEEDWRWIQSNEVTVYSSFSNI